VKVVVRGTLRRGGWTWQIDVEKQRGNGRRKRV